MNGGPIVKEKCSSTWDLFEIWFGNSDGAIDATVVASSGYNANYYPSNVVDGDLATFWAGNSSDGVGSGQHCGDVTAVQWLTLDLGSTKTVTGIHVAQALADSSWSVDKIQYACSNDNQVWTSPTVINVNLLGSSTLFSQAVS